MSRPQEAEGLSCLDVTPSFSAAAQPRGAWMVQEAGWRSPVQAGAVRRGSYVPAPLYGLATSALGDRVEGCTKWPGRMLHTQIL